MTPTVRVSVQIAANYLRIAPMNMGDVMDLLGCARTVEEAAHLRAAYIDAICGDGVEEGEAQSICDENIRFGADYMGVCSLLPLYFPENVNG